MKKVWIPMLAIFLVLGSGMAALGAEVLKFSFDDWCPYICAKEGQMNVLDPEEPGYYIEVLRAIYEPAGYEPDFLLRPWGRAMQETRSGRLDALLSPAKSEAPDLVFPEEEIGMLGWCFYTLSGMDWNYAGPVSLLGIALGVLKGNDFGPEVQPHLERYADDPQRVQMVTGMDWKEKNIRRLQLGRIGAFLDEPSAIDLYLKRNDLAGDIRKAGCLPAEKMYVAFSPENPNAEKLANVYDAGIQELRASGRLSEILSRYGLEDWRK